MRIAINCRSILKAQRTGIGRYTYHLIEALGDVAPDNEYLLYSPRRIFDFKRKLPLFRGTCFRPVYDLWKQGPVRTTGGFDIYHSPCFDMVDGIPGKVVVTVHDLVYKAHPQSHTTLTVETTDRQMKSMTARADAIICVSESTRRDLLRFFDLPEAKVRVVHHGVDHRIFFRMADDKRELFRESLRTRGIDGEFLLFVGTLEPRKNLDGILKALHRLKDENRFAGKLVIVAGRGWMSEGIPAIIQHLRLSQEAVFLDGVRDEELRGLYNCASAFVFPSLYEGFGFPILEAMACGAPVVTSNVSSCPEVAGDAALMVDPHDPRAIAEALGEALRSPGLRAGLQVRGLARAREFTFAKTARETLAVYQSLGRT